MTKRNERDRESSCWNRAEETELVFILLERDVTAPATVRDWANRRIIAGKNNISDEQIQEALRWADAVEYRRNAKQELNKTKETDTMTQVDGHAIEYSKLPEKYREIMRMYFEDGVRPGGLWNYLLTGDLRVILLDLDGIDFATLEVIVAWLYNETPGRLWGSTDNVNKHINDCAARRRAAKVV